MIDIHIDSWYIEKLVEHSRTLNENILKKQQNFLANLIYKNKKFRIQKRNTKIRGFLTTYLKLIFEMMENIFNCNLT